MANPEVACLYACRVMHRRLVAPFYRFVYRVFYLLLDIDHIDGAIRDTRLFSHNRFNLLAFHDRDHGDGSLRAVIAEVRNTFGEKHAYLLGADGAAMPYETPQEKDKCFHVSPFLDLVGRYRFTLGEPGERLRVAIHESREGQAILDATVAGERRPLGDVAILGLVALMPFMTLKVVAGIHWEALKIWLRGGKFHRKPEPPSTGVS